MSSASAQQTAEQRNIDPMITRVTPRHRHPYRPQHRSAAADTPAQVHAVSARARPAPVELPRIPAVPAHQTTLGPSLVVDAHGYGDGVRESAGAGGNSAVVAAGVENQLRHQHDSLLVLPQNGNQGAMATVAVIADAGGAGAEGDTLAAVGDGTRSAASAGTRGGIPAVAAAERMLLGYAGTPVVVAERRTPAAAALLVEPAPPAADTASSAAL